MASLENRFKEQAVLLGRRRTLVGVVARPHAAHRREEPTVVILNTGIVHRVGHHRMYVDLSRQLAARGRTVVRFDFSGIGDSRPRGDGLPPMQAAMADLTEVLDGLGALHQETRFVLVGLCSGADQAVLYAGSDPRVVGVMLMDPTLPPTTRYYFHYVRQRLLQLRPWASVLTGRSGLMRLIYTQLEHLRQPRSARTATSLNDLRFSPLLRSSYRALAARGVKMLAVFTGLSVRHTYPEQIMDAFPEVAACGHLRLETLRGSDHLFSSDEQRTHLFQVALEWLGAA